MKYLPDTNVLIYALAGKSPYAGWLRKIIEEGKLVLSVITVAEFLSGANENEAILFKSITNKFEVLPIDLQVAQKAAEYEAPSTLRSGYLLPTLRRERNPSEAKNSSLSSTGLRPRYFAKGDKRNYSKKTKKVWMSDCLIAATCKIFGATLTTFNSKDYPMKDIEVITKV